MDAAQAKRLLSKIDFDDIEKQIQKLGEPHTEDSNTNSEVAGRKVGLSASVPQMNLQLLESTSARSIIDLEEELERLEAESLGVPKQIRAESQRSNSNSSVKLSARSRKATTTSARQTNTETTLPKLLDVPPKKVCLFDETRFKASHTLSEKLTQVKAALKLALEKIGELSSVKQEGFTQVPAFSDLTRGYTNDLAILESGELDSPPEVSLVMTTHLERDVNKTLLQNELLVIVSNATNLASKSENLVNSFICAEVDFGLAQSPLADSASYSAAASADVLKELSADPETALSDLKFKKGYSSPSKAGCSPEYRCGFRIPPFKSRSTFRRFIERKQVQFEVKQSQGWFLKSKCLGKASVPLKPLFAQSSFSACLPLIDHSKTPTGGKLFVRLALREPIERESTISVTYGWPLFRFIKPKQGGVFAGCSASVVQEFSTAQKDDKEAKQADERNAALAENSGHLTLSKSLQELRENFMNPTNIESLGVLESELEILQRQPIEDDLTRRIAIKVKINLLQSVAASGQITPETYRQTLKSQLELVRDFVAQFRQFGDELYAQKAELWLQLIKSEIKEIDDSLQVSLGH